ncbi:pentatricopeptide repeat-containing protein At5g66520-like [Neltuma alba]|uniref:pentatricopeptide repeat-containing protein At5g66520-like n=1 Tax=Neltuma alba TaxID=207710 RepID=UPI0010A51D4F|nr:pentatricopeptide repeat-containing protein At5g66520-like [Prosopis alba]
MKCSRIPTVLWIFKPANLWEWHDQLEQTEVALLEGIYKTNEQVNYVNYNLITPESSKRNFLKSCVNYSLALRKHLVNASSIRHGVQDFKQLKRIHALSVTLGILPNFQSLACNLLETYKNLGKLRDAQNIFNQIQHPDIVSWTSLLNLYLHSNLPAESLAVFSLYIDSGFRPDSFLVVEALLSCGRGKDLIRGRAIHGMILRNHLDVNSFVGNAPVDMYCQNGKIEVAALVFERKRLNDIFAWTTLFNGYILSNDLHSARQLFNKMPERNAVSWTSMITGYVKGGAPVQALELFWKMEVRPSTATIVAILSACADTGALNIGLSIHGNVNKTNLELDVIVNNALMDMYSRSGRLGLAIRIFDEILDKDVFSRTTMISSYAYHGKGQHALEVHSQMLKSKLTPNEVTLLSLLTACSHLGLVLEGKMLFNRMIHYHHLKPSIQHYGCLVDLLGRAGFLEEAKEVIEMMPIEPDAAI